MASQQEIDAALDAALDDLGDDDDDDDDEEDSHHHRPIFAQQYSPKPTLKKTKLRRTVSANPSETQSHQARTRPSQQYHHLSKLGSRRKLQRSSSLSGQQLPLDLLLRRGSSRRLSASSNASQSTTSTKRRNLAKGGKSSSSALDIQQQSGFVTGSRIRRIDSNKPNLTRR